MMIDTLEYVKELEAAGLDRRLAEAHAKALRNAATEHLVTKQDLDAAVARLEMTLVKYMVAQTLGIVGLLLATGGILIRLLLR